LKTVNEELDRFAYSMAHDLRAPLRTMQGFSTALLGLVKTLNLYWLVLNKFPEVG
jgi:signal transduction histidine kinase